MMGYIKSFIYEFNNTYTVDDRVITILFSAIFLPWQLAIVITLGVTLFLLVKTDFIATFKRVAYAKVLLLFALYLFVVSLINHDWMSALSSIAAVMMFVNIIHFREFIHRDLFEQLLDIAIILSLFAVAYGIVEQFHYMSIVDGMGFFDIQNKPIYRVHTFYNNANYYAYTILLIEAMCVYKFFRIEDLRFRVYYIGAGIFNLFALFLTGGRIAWLALAGGVVVMLFVNRWYKLFATAIVGVGGVCGLLALKPGLLPRLAQRGFKIERRLQIWRTAKLMIEDSWLLGKGPMGYLTNYASYQEEYIATYGLKSFRQYKLGISANHAHSIFLEPILSYGIVGCVIICLYLGYEIKQMVALAYHKIDPTLASLLIGTLVMTFLFSLMDFPLYWVQSGYLLLLLFGSSDMYRHELKSKRQ